MPSLIELRSGPLRAVLCPEVGGSITCFDALVGGRQWPVLRPCVGSPESVLDAASFPLVPFVNSIRGGRFEFRGRSVTLEPNMPPDISPLHGQGWLAPWSVEAQEEDSAILSYHHAAGEWPWEFEARQTLRLDPQGLSISMTCRNISPDPMPCGLGHHPFFLCSGETRIDTEVEHVWTIDENVLPVEKIAATGEFDLRDRKVCGQDLDHGFDGWGRTATISASDVPFDILLTSANARFFQLYSPAEGGIFVAEPVTHANAALNAPESQWAVLGIAILEPGGETTLEARIAIRTKEVEGP